ncbi:hypothetical protein PX699_16810 [Sphingobium sp. H39-3-25]|uniref:hypothetical protein n=1 Tax=Sphingomonadales TaxID=204457 RepID=UPI000831D230|nr:MULTISPECIES: hypothetical protein [Sphingomonadaceae]MDF0491465.1 hypothetical protein [Sphingomonas pollutisoli]MDF0544015.1 hypothetical protein [Sphingobium arseniciresistens]
MADCITDNGWTLHYTIGHKLAAKVKSGDLVHLPGDRGDLLVLGGRAPLRAEDSGCVIVRNAVNGAADTFEARPGALGLVWISAAGGWSESPEDAQLPTRYNQEAVQRQIERDRRRHRISKKEERLIHALLKGRGG